MYKPVQHDSCWDAMTTWQTGSSILKASNDVEPYVSFRLAAAYTPTIKSDHGTIASLQQAATHRQPAALSDP